MQFALNWTCKRLDEKETAVASGQAIYSVQRRLILLVVVRLIGQASQVRAVQVCYSVFRDSTRGENGGTGICNWICLVAQPSRADWGLVAIHLPCPSPYTPVDGNLVNRFSPPQTSIPSGPGGGGGGALHRRVSYPTVF